MSVRNLGGHFWLTKWRRRRNGKWVANAHGGLDGGSRDACVPSALDAWYASSKVSSCKFGRMWNGKSGRDSEATHRVRRRGPASTKSFDIIAKHCSSQESSSATPFSRPSFNCSVRWKSGTAKKPGDAFGGALGVRKEMYRCSIRGLHSLGWMSKNVRKASTFASEVKARE